MCLRKKKKTELNNFKKLRVFSHKLQTMGVNGLTQISFISQLTRRLLKNAFQYSYHQKPEKILVGNAIKIMDVRQNPHVKKGFKPAQLKNLLAAHDFEYIRFKGLGNPFYKRQLKEKDFSKAKAEYQHYLLTNPRAKIEFEKLYHQLHEDKINILICYCQIEDCHRFWLMESLINKKRKELGFSQDYQCQINKPIERS